MSHSQSSWSFEQSEPLEDVLREQGASPEECADLLPALQRLSEWQAPQVSSADTQRLLAQLTPELLVHSPVRQAIHEHQQHRVAFLLATARTQVRIFGPGFWLVSALITLVGVGAVTVLRNVVPDQTGVLQALVLRISGPMLAFLGTIVAFRGRRARMMELELVCLPSSLQLAIARLVIVLGYDVGLSLALSLLLWASGSGQVLALTLSWFTPLLLVAGLAFLLSMRFTIQIAASLAYGSWLAFLTINTIVNAQSLQFAPALFVLPGCIGLALLALALLCIHTNIYRLLPHMERSRTF